MSSIEISEIFSPKALRLAWERYIRTGQRESKDYFGIRAFGSNLDVNLQSLSESLQKGEFRPTRPPKFYRPKSSGMQRTITILPVADALVYQAIANDVAVRTYARMDENKDFVFGTVLHEEVALGLKVLDKPDAEFFFFKPYLSLYKAFADSVNEAIRVDKVTHKFETDITGFFDAIPHYNLLAFLGDECGVHEEILDLLGDCLNVWSGTREGPTPGVGIPQATSASHFFANLFLHDLDNLIKDRGLRYYRYMDDIRIYGYSHDELQRLLVELDRYLKRHALSLNAKKTGIEKLTIENEADSFIAFEYGKEQAEASAQPDSGDEFASLAEQDGAINDDKGEETSSHRKKTIEACRVQLLDVARVMREKLSPKGRKTLSIHDRSVQREFMGLGFRFRQAHRILKELGVPAKLGGPTEIDGWLFLLDQYFWLADQFCWTLGLYENNRTVKTRLLELAGKYQCYEWVGHHLYQCLALSQEFSTKELRDMYRSLDGYKDWYTKRTVYLLLLSHSRDSQFLMSIVAHAAGESDPVLKREVLSCVELWGKKGLSREQLMDALGVR